ncbi:MAG TPA: hypothetical protein VIM79_21550 [Niastella sp.]
MKKNFTPIALPLWTNPAWAEMVVVPLHTNSNAIDALAYSLFTNNIPNIAAVPLELACVVSY